VARSKHSHNALAFLKKTTPKSMAIYYVNSKQQQNAQISTRQAVSKLHG